MLYVSCSIFYLNFMLPLNLNLIQFFLIKFSSLTFFDVLSNHGNKILFHFYKSLKISTESILLLSVILKISIVQNLLPMQYHQT